MLLRPQLHQRDGLLVLIAQSLGADHLCEGIARPQLPADRPKGDVRDPGHWGQDEGGGNGYGSDAHGSTFFL